MSPLSQVIQKRMASDIHFSTQFVNVEAGIVVMIILYSISVKSGSKNSLMIHKAR